MKKLFYIVLSGCLLLSSSVYAKKSKDLVLCTWNLGYFSNGISSISSIDVVNYKESLAKYRCLIYSEILPDVITLNEYNYVFCGKNDKNNPYLTSSLLFNGFKKKQFGPKCLGVSNAIFSKIKMTKFRFFYFESQKITAGDDEVKLRDNYFLESDLYIQGKKIKLVCLHLLFSGKVREVFQQNQIEELISRYKKTDRVILSGDWNTEMYSALKDAGYELANDGSLKTFPSKGYALDNIAVKGLNISDVRMIKTNLSDHYPLICRLSLKE